jgi:hypothetical protein
MASRWSWGGGQLLAGLAAFQLLAVDALAVEAVASSSSAVGRVP